MNKGAPLVSVQMITYNHEKYIAQAIEGVLMQKTTFPIELVIGEDCSTDNTRAICIEYKNKYPNIITLLLPERNLGMHENGNQTFASCTGKYIAICEGDDYWTDPLKLQKQVDFLEKNLDYGLVYTDFFSVDENGREVKKELRRRPIHPSGNVLSILTKRNFIQTLTVLGRKEYWDKAIATFQSISDFDAIDYALFFEIAGHTKVKYLPYVTAAYRILSESASHSSGVEKKIQFAENTSKILNYYNTLYSLGISENEIKRRYIMSILSIYSRYKKKADFGKFFLRSLWTNPKLLITPVVYYHLLFLFKR